eukprot:PhM_4_TR8450/c0_g1_i1/m.1415/K17906/ATG2; autophagy-related protein 2
MNGVQNRIVCFIVRRFAGLYLSKELELSQVQSSFMNGNYSLQGPLEVNCAEINRNILANSPFELVAGSVDSIEISIPLQVLYNASVNIAVKVKGVHVRLQLTDDARVAKESRHESEQFASAMTRSIVGDMSADEVEVKELLTDVQEQQPTAPAASVNGEMGAGEALSALLNSYIQNMKVKLEDVDVQLCVPKNNSNNSNSSAYDVLHFYIPDFDVHAADSGPTATTSVEGGGGGASEPVISKEVHFTGVHVQLYEVCPSDEEAFATRWDPSQLRHYVLGSVSRAEPNSINLKISEQHGLQHMEVHVHSLHGIVTPVMAAQLKSVVARISTAVPPSNDLEAAHSARHPMTLKIRVADGCLACLYHDPESGDDATEGWASYLDGSAPSPCNNLEPSHCLVIVKGANVRSGSRSLTGEDLLSQVNRLVGGTTLQVRIEGLVFEDVHNGSAKQLLRLSQEESEYAFCVEVLSTAPIPTSFAQQQFGSQWVSPLTQPGRYFALQDVNFVVRGTVDVLIDVNAIDRVVSYVLAMTRKGVASTASSIATTPIRQVRPVQSVSSDGGFFDALDTSTFPSDDLSPPHPTMARSSSHNASQQNARGGGASASVNHVNVYRNVQHIISRVCVDVLFPAASTVPPYVFGPLTDRTVTLCRDAYRLPDHLTKALRVVAEDVVLSTIEDQTADFGEAVWSVRASAMTLGFRHLLSDVRDEEALLVVGGEDDAVVAKLWIRSSESPFPRTRFDSTMDTQEQASVEQEMSLRSAVHIDVRVPHIRGTLFQDQYLLLVYFMSKVSDHISATLQKILPQNDDATDETTTTMGQTSTSVSHRETTMFAGVVCSKTTINIAAESVLVNIHTPRLDADEKPISWEWFYSHLSTAPGLADGSVMHPYLIRGHHARAFVASMVTKKTTGVCFNLTVMDVVLEELLPVVDERYTHPQCEDSFTHPYGDRLLHVSTARTSSDIPCVRVLFGMVLSPGRQDNSVHVVATNVVWSHHVSHPGDNLLSTLMFFISDTPTPLTPSPDDDDDDDSSPFEYLAITTRVVVEARNSFVDYAPVRRPGRVIAHFAGAKMSGQFTTNSTASRISIVVDGASMFLNVRFTDNFAQRYLDLQKVASGDLRVDLAVFGFQRVLHLASTEYSSPTCIRVEQGVDPRKPMSIAISAAHIEANLACDSIILLGRLATHYGQSSDLVGVPPPAELVARHGQQFVSRHVVENERKAAEQSAWRQQQNATVTRTGPNHAHVDVGALAAALEVPVTADSATPPPPSLVTRPRPHAVVVSRKQVRAFDEIPATLTMTPEYLHSAPTCFVDLIRVEDSDSVDTERVVTLKANQVMRTDLRFLPTNIETATSEELPDSGDELNGDDDGELARIDLTSPKATASTSSRPQAANRPLTDTSAASTTTTSTSRAQQPKGPRGRWFTDEQDVTSHFLEPFVTVPERTLRGCPFETSFADHEIPLIDLQLLDCSVTARVLSGKDFKYHVDPDYALGNLSDRRNAAAAGTNNNNNGTGATATPRGVLDEDWEFVSDEDEQYVHESDEVVDVNLHGIDLHIATFPRSDKPSVERVMHCKAWVRSFDIDDNVASSSARKMLTSLRDTSERFAEDYALRVAWDIMSPRPASIPEHRLVVDVSPMRVVVDQATVNFGVSFAAELERHYSESEREEAAAAADPMSATFASSASPAVSPSRPLPLFFQLVKISALRVVVDYHPQHFDHVGLMQGNNLELINVTSLEELAISLPAVAIRGANTTSLRNHVVAVYSNELMGVHFPLRVVCTLGPIRPAANILRGAADLVLVPVEHYRTHQNLYRGVQKGLVRFSTSVMSEICNVFHAVGSTAASGVDYVVSSWSTCSTEMPRRGNEPEDFTTGLQRAKAVLSSGMRETVAVVARARATGEVRDVPLIMLLPARNVLNAISQSFLGLRNSVEPSRKKVNKRLFKA